MVVTVIFLGLLDIWHTLLQIRIGHNYCVLIVKIGKIVEIVKIGKSVEIVKIDKSVEIVKSVKTWKLQRLQLAYLLYTT